MCAFALLECSGVGAPGQHKERAGPFCWVSVESCFAFWLGEGFCFLVGGRREELTIELHFEFFDEIIGVSGVHISICVFG